MRVQNKIQSKIQKSLDNLKNPIQELHDELVGIVQALGEHNDIIDNDIESKQKEILQKKDEILELVELKDNNELKIAEVKEKIDKLTNLV